MSIQDSQRINALEQRVKQLEDRCDLLMARLGELYQQIIGANERQLKAAKRG